MITVFNQFLPVQGVWSISFNVIIERAATAQAESNNEAVWLVQAGWS